MNTNKIYAEHIANEYSIKKESKVIALKNLDRKAKLPADIFVYSNGIIMSLILCGKSVSIILLISESMTIFIEYLKNKEVKGSTHHGWILFCNGGNNMHIVENINVGFAGVKNGCSVISEEDTWGNTINLVKITYVNTLFNFPLYKEIEYILTHLDSISNYKESGIIIELNPYNLQDGMNLFKKWLNLLRRNKQ